MKKIVTVFGDQAAPLLLLAATMQEDWECHIITTSQKQVEAEYLCSALEAFSQVKGRHLHQVVYNDLVGITKETAAVIGNGDGVIVDITGGTKLMSLGVYAAAQGTKAQIVYVDTGSRRILDITQPQSHSFIHAAFSASVDYRVILRAYGKEVREAEEDFTQAELRGLLEYIQKDVARWAEFWKWYTGLLGNRTQQQGNLLSVEASRVNRKTRQILGFLQEIQFMNRVKGDGGDCFLPASVKVADYLRRGSWLEDLVHYTLTGHFDQVKKSVSILIKKPAEQLREGAFPWYIENEVDVLVNEKGLLLFLECKAGQGKAVLGNIANTLPKIERVSEKNAGYFARSALVLPYSKNQVTQEFLAKAERAKIRVFCLEQINCLEQHVARLLYK